MSTSLNLSPSTTSILTSACSAGAVDLDPRAVPEPQLDLDRGFEPRCCVHLQLAGALRQGPVNRGQFAWGFGCVAIGFFIYGVGARWAVMARCPHDHGLGLRLYSLGSLR